MKRPMIMITLLLVILFASFVYFFRGLALALLGGIASKVGAQAGGNLTILAGMLMAISAVCAWAFVNAVWNFKPWARAYGFFAASFALVSVMFNLAQGATFIMEVTSIIMAVCITSYSLMYGVQLRAIRRNYSPVASYGHS